MMNNRHVPMLEDLGRDVPDLEERDKRKRL